MIPGSASPLLLAGAAEAAGYEIPRSLRFNSSDSANLYKSFSSQGSGTKSTLSFWIKRAKIGLRNTIFTGYGSTGGNFAFAGLEFQADDLVAFGNNAGYIFLTNQVFRDPSAWYHFVITYDTTQATASDRIKFFINGSRVTSLSYESYPGQNSSAFIFGDTHNFIGANQSAGNPFNPGDFYLADVHFIDGQALDPTDFGEYDANNVWQPKAFAGSYGAVAVSEATGALPIFNTTDTYGAVKGTGTRTDSNSSSIVLAVPMDGANNGTTFTDESATIKGSGSNKSITRNGDTKTVTSQYNFYGSSGYFDGTGDYLTAPAGSDFAFSGDFTIEGWVYSGVTGNRSGIIGNRTGSGLDTVFAVVLNPQNLANWGYIYVHTDATIIAQSNTPFPLNQWFHFAVCRSGSAIKIYMNGTEVGSSTSSNNFSSTTDTLYIGREGARTDQSSPLNGYLQDIRIYKGVAKYTSNFTVVRDNNGNGFYLDFSDNSSNAALGYDAAGSNDWTVYNLSVASGAGNDSLVDSPINGDQTDTGAGGEVVGNYATLNPLQKSSGSTLSNGNLDISMSSAQGTTFATMAFPASGKWYFECTANASQSDVGIAKAGADLSQYLGKNSNGYGYYIDGNVYHNDSSAGSGASYGNGDIIGVAFDADAGTCKWYKNNALQVTISSLSGEWFPAFGSGSAAGIFNFGQRPFAYTAPSGFKALNTASLPDPTIADGSTVFDATLYTGNGSTQTISGLGFSPDLVWSKDRGSSSYWHTLFDTVRGAGKRLGSNETNAEVTNFALGYLSAFTSDGFTVGPGSISSEEGNRNSAPYVAWTWDAGTSTGSNTDGTITVSQRLNQSAGFSISTYTGNGTAGATFGHGLNAVPDMIIIKARDSVADGSWIVGHSAMGLGYARLLLNTDAANNGTPGNVVAYDLWNNTAATSSVVSIGSYNAVNDNGDKYVAYCWTAVDGYSSFGSYVGNGSSDGPFVFTGMRPKWLLIKNSSNGGNWNLFDTSRSTYNATGELLLPNLPNLEYSQPPYNDFLSNGFKLRTDDSGKTGLNTNQSGQTYVFAAFSEHPFKTARAR